MGIIGHKQVKWFNGNKSLQHNAECPGSQQDRGVSWAYSEPDQISKMKLFTKIVNGFQPLTILTKSSILEN